MISQTSVLLHFWKRASTMSWCTTFIDARTHTHSLQNADGQVLQYRDQCPSLTAVAFRMIPKNCVWRWLDALPPFLFVLAVCWILSSSTFSVPISCKSAAILLWFTDVVKLVLCLFYLFWKSRASYVREKKNLKTFFFNFCWTLKSPFVTETCLAWIKMIKLLCTQKRTN